MIIFILIITTCADKIDPRFNQFREDIFDETLNNYQKLIVFHEQLSEKYVSLKNEHERLLKSCSENNDKLNKCINDIIECASEYSQCSHDFSDLSSDYDKISNGTLTKKYKSTISNLKLTVSILIGLIGMLIIVICIELYIYNQMSNKNAKKKK